MGSAGGMSGLGIAAFVGLPHSLAQAYFNLVTDDPAYPEHKCALGRRLGPGQQMASQLLVCVESASRTRGLRRAAKVVLGSVPLTVVPGPLQSLSCTGSLKSPGAAVTRGTVLHTDSASK